MISFLIPHSIAWCDVITLSHHVILYCTGACLRVGCENLISCFVSLWVFCNTGFLPVLSCAPCWSWHISITLHLQLFEFDFCDFFQRPLKRFACGASWHFDVQRRDVCMSCAYVCPFVGLFVCVFVDLPFYCPCICLCKKGQARLNRPTSKEHSCDMPPGTLNVGKLYLTEPT